MPPSVLNLKSDGSTATFNYRSQNLTVLARREGRAVGPGKPAVSRVMSMGGFGAG